MKDSFMYNAQKAPVNSQYEHVANTMRRNYWPVVDNTVTSLTSKAVAGANAVKNLLKVGFYHTFDNVNAALQHKKQKIKSYLIQAAQEHQIALQQAKENEKHKQQMKLAVAANAEADNLAASLASNAANLASNIASSVSSSIASTPGITATAGTITGSITGAIAGTVAANLGSKIPLTNNLQHPLLGKHGLGLLPIKQKLVQHIANHLKPFIKRPLNIVPPSRIVYSKTRPLPTTTISEDYIHTYDNKYNPPKMFAHERNPYADMGVTSYKHFEDTILKELEEKEERKVEATMHTLFDEDKYVIRDSLEGTKPAIQQHTEWLPFNINEDHSALFTTPKTVEIGGFISSTFDRPVFSDVRPVCEHLDDTVQPTVFVFPNSADSQVNEQQAASNQNTVIAVANQTNSSTTTEKPNYPAYFIKQQQQVRKLQQKLLGASRGKSTYGQKTQQNVKLHQRQKFNQRTPLLSISSTTTTTTTSPIVSSSSTEPSSLLFYSFNGTDDGGFRPMLPSEIKAMKIKKPIHIKFNDSASSATATKPNRWIEAQASQLHLSVVSPPNATRTLATTDSTIRHSPAYMRKTPKKVRPKESTFVGTKSGNSTAATKSNQKIYRGAIKFSDSLHQSR